MNSDPDQLLRFDPAWRDDIQALWSRLMALAVWGDLKARSVGGLPKIRKRLLDLGEKWRSIFNDRDWIPQPRERVKNLVGSILNLRDSLLQFEQAVLDIDGGEARAEFERLVLAQHQAVVGPVTERGNRLAELLDRLNREALDAGDDEA